MYAHLLSSLLLPIWQGLKSPDALSVQGQAKSSTPVVPLPAGGAPSSANSLDPRESAPRRHLDQFIRFDVRPRGDVCSSSGHRALHARTRSMRGESVHLCPYRLQDALETVF